MRKATVAARRSRQAMLAAIPAGRLSYATGVIKTVTAGGAVDGNAQVVVTVNGSDTLAPYHASYTTPTVGHLVSVLIVDGSPVILGHVIGLPTF